MDEPPNSCLEQWICALGASTRTTLLRRVKHQDLRWTLEFLKFRDILLHPFFPSVDRSTSDAVDPLKKAWKCQNGWVFTSCCRWSRQSCGNSWNGTVEEQCCILYGRFVNDMTRLVRLTRYSSLLLGLNFNVCSWFGCIFLFWGYTLTFLASRSLNMDSHVHLIQLWYYRWFPS